MEKEKIKAWWKENRDKVTNILLGASCVTGLVCGVVSVSQANKSGLVMTMNGKKTRLTGKQADAFALLYHDSYYAVNARTPIPKEMQNEIISNFRAKSPRAYNELDKINFFIHE